MLPFPVDRLMIPVLQYPAGNPPAIPNIHVPNGYQQIIPLVASAVANEVGLQAPNSPARTFTYNLMSYGGWTSPYYQAAIKLTIDSGIIKKISNPNLDITNAILESVTDTLTLITSKIVADHPELQQHMTPEMVNASINNTVILTDIQGRVASIYAQMGQVTPPIVAPYGGPPQRVAVKMQELIPTNPDKPSRIYIKPSNSSTKTTTVTTPPAIGAYKPYPTPVADNASKPSTSNISKDTDMNVYLSNSNTPITGDVESFKQDIDMDRNQHSVVYYGNKIRITQQPIRQNFTTTVEKHEDIVQKQDQGVNIDDPCIVNDLHVSGSIEDILQETMIKAMNNEKAGKNAQLYRGHILHPIFSREMNGLTSAVTRLFQDFTGANTLTYVQDVINNSIKQYKDEEWISHYLNVVGQIDRVLTNIVNTFITRMLDHDSVYIESFTEDYADILAYLPKNNGDKETYMKAFNTFQSSLLKTLFVYSKSGGEYEYTESVFDSKLVLLEALAESYSVIYYPENSRTLGYTFTSKPKPITQEDTPLLYKLLTALILQNKANESSNHVLMTEDGLRVRIFPVLKGEHRFRAVVI